MMNRKRKLKRGITMLLAVIMLLGMMVQFAYAYEKIDMGKEATLAVEFTSGTKVPGMEFRAYRIATVDQDANFAFTEAIASYGFEMPKDQAGYRELAETLAAYVARDGITPVARSTTDDNGYASFGILEKGIYLVLADKYTNPADKMTYIVSPSLVSLPNSANGKTWDYDVVISPKYREIPPLPDTPGETVDINVIKVWTGEVNKTKRPTYVYAELVCDGAVIDMVTLNSGNNWRHTWKDLDASKTYNVTEKEVPAGYTVTITRDGNTFTMNNYSGDVPPTNPPVPKLPQTGQTWWPVPILGGIGLAFIIMGKLRKRSA